MLKKVFIEENGDPNFLGIFGGCCFIVMACIFAFAPFCFCLDKWNELWDFEAHKPRPYDYKAEKASATK